MGALIFWGIIIGLSLLISLISWFNNIWKKSKEYDKVSSRIKSLESNEAELNKKQAEWEKKVQSDKLNWEKKVQSDKDAINIIVKEKSLGFPWLAKAISDYYELRDLQIARYLETKGHPAQKSADTVREIAREKKQLAREYRVAKYLLEYYEVLFPWLIDFRGEDLDELIKQTLDEKNDKRQLDELDDPARQWLTESEFTNLSLSEKNQLALDRYWQQRKKPKWEIGRDYERYIGYLYEKDKYTVNYHGILQGYEDMGRDLICKKDNHIEIVQCKCWSKDTVIHEKHINQLFGTSVMYWIQEHGTEKLDHFFEELNNEIITPMFITSTELSSTAKQFACALGVKIWEKCPLEPYPSIKCNINFRDHSRIYHLPFDQQYDRTRILEEKNECYAWTIKEAEQLGFRRAFRWRGSAE